MQRVRVDEKGKVFSERVRKTSVEVQITTVQEQMRGFVHLMPGQRVKDLLNDLSEQFLAITSATVVEKGSSASNTNGNGRNQTGPLELHTEIGFIALNKHYIMSVVPIDEEKIARLRDEEHYIPR